MISFVYVFASYVSIILGITPTKTIWPLEKLKKKKKQREKPSWYSLLSNERKEEICSKNRERYARKKLNKIRESTLPKKTCLTIGERRKPDPAIMTNLFNIFIYIYIYIYIYVTYNVMRLFSIEALNHEITNNEVTKKRKERVSVFSSFEIGKLHHLDLNKIIICNYTNLINFS